MRRIVASGVLLAALALPLLASAQSTPTPSGSGMQSDSMMGNASAVIGEVTPIEIGQSVSGELTDAAPAAFFSFTGTAGQSVSIIHVSEDFDSYLVLLDSEENVLAANDDGAGDLDSLITFTLPSDGTYIIRADSYGNYNGVMVSTGAFTLTLNAVERDVIEYGQVIDGELTASMPAATFVFTGSAGDSITIRQESNAFDSYLTLNDPDGFELAYNDDGAGNLNSLIGPLTLPVTGEYTITATSLSRSDVGAFTLTLSRVQIQPAAIGETVTGSIDSAGAQAFVSFEGAIGDVISVSVDSEIDTNLTLNDPNNYFLISDEDGGSGVNPEISGYVLGQTGTYTLVIGSAVGDVGEFSLKITREALPSLNEGDQVLSFTSATTTRSISYTAEAGESVVVTFTARSGVASPSVDITQAGMSLAYGSASSVSSFSMAFTVPESGDLVLSVSEYSYTDASLIVSIAPAGE
jgi:hypothetical protein